MGVSSDGVLVFGFEIGEEGQEPEFLCQPGEEYALDFEDFVVMKSDLNENPSFEDRQNAIAACPADMTLYCSIDYPMHILAVRGTEVTVSRGYTEEIKPESLIVSPDRIAAFKFWCEKNGIEYHEPKWLLCSMYG